MAEYVYPAVFHPNTDGTFTVLYPDLPGCVSEGKSLENALHMAQDALTQWISAAVENGIPFADATPLQDVSCEAGEFINLMCAEVKDERAVRRTVSIPRWMDDRASAAGLSLSRVLQDALRDRLHVN